jgi:hypothetical protein
VGHLREDGTGETRKLATHSGRAHKLALDPSAAAAFYSCGEDGVVSLFVHRLEMQLPDLDIRPCTSASTGPSDALEPHELPYA